MLRLNILPSPSAAIHLTRYEETSFPKFSELFHPVAAQSALSHLARDPNEAESSVVFENRSENAVTALRYRWRMIDELGKETTHTASSDSYTVDIYRPVAEPGSRHLIGPSGMLDEALIDHVRAGRGFMGSHHRIKQEGKSEAEIVEITFEIDFLLFDDGEIAGPDVDGYATDLMCRKPASEFVAKQIRLAAAENRDVTPVLSALAEIPHFGSLHHAQGDRQVLWTRRYAEDYLRAMSRTSDTIDWREARLRSLENRPTLPKFYRQPQ